MGIAPLDEKTKPLKWGDAKRRVFYGLERGKHNQGMGLKRYRASGLEVIIPMTIQSKPCLPLIFLDKRLFTGGQSVAQAGRAMREAVEFLQ